MKLKYTLPLLLITILCIAGVDGFYYFFEHRVAGDRLDAPKGPAASGQQPGFSPSPPGTMGKESGEQAMGSNSTPEPGGGNTSPGTDALGPTPLAKTEQLAAIVDRNLFASRSGKLADKQEKDPLEGVELSSLDVVLMGTITGPDDSPRAIILDKKERKQELYQQGDFVQQAAIKQIMRGKVILNLNGKDEMLDIAEARNVNVPQIPKPGVPITTAQRVIGRPTGSPAGAPTSSQPVIRPENGARVVVPRAGGSRQLRSFRGGVIVKGRNTSPQ